MDRLFLTLWLLFSSSIWAQRIVVSFDPDRTEIHWSLAGSVHTTHGTFRLKQGHVEVDPSTGTISGSVIADATSGDSGNKSRDSRMNKEVLESDRFPEFRFVPLKLEGKASRTGRSSVRVTGEFSIHGSAHSLTIPIDVSMSGDTFTGTGKFSVPYVDWGMKDPSKLILKVDKSVEVEVTAIGRLGLKQNSESPEPK